MTARADGADWWTRPRDVTVVVDTEGWFDPFAHRLVEAIAARGDRARFVRRHDHVAEGDVAFFLSCLKIARPETLSRNRINLVAHASALPKGRGFSPVVWQILEGRHTIPLSLIEACDPVDSGPIYLRSELTFEGHELNEAIRDALGEAVNAICLDYLDAPAPPEPVAQTGEPSWYARRRTDDSRLDPEASIVSQFDLLRVVDNARYPAFFETRGRRYRLTIEDDGPARG